jgi:capsular exopolysaccharide synthesis family protein
VSSQRALPGRRLPRRARAGAEFEDAFQVLQASLSAALADVIQPRVMVTSPSGGEGKTTTCVNLARGYAATGRRVVVLDLDLRHPDAHRLFGAHNEYGLSDLVLERRPPEDCLQFVALAGPDTTAGGLYFLGTGPVGENPAALLSMDRTAKMLDLIASQADLVLIDTPPVLTVADALVVGPLVSGALLVAEAHRTTHPELARAKDLLLRNRTRVLGVVLNRFDRLDERYWEPPASNDEASAIPG